ncbi:hypothetical protein BJB45_05330 [Halomonas huangheensis]|uniref:Uncharacterized protein n=1 Tax=Halomonas huangheensis TaxID=1178482 RepID=W1N6I5_9GAMM|nr:hypothetical protein BJB45_05330 [Halomonas huangheensis]
MEVPLDLEGCSEEVAEQDEAQEVWSASTAAYG